MIKPSSSLTYRHLIYSYHIENIGLVEVFRALSDDAYITRRFLKLKDPDHSPLMDKLKIMFDALFAKPNSYVAPSFEESRKNAYWTMFGYTIRGEENLKDKKQSFRRTNYYNATFNKTFEDALYQIAQIILDTLGPPGGITTEHTGNPEALARLCNDLKEMAESRRFNLITDISKISANVFDMALSLLDDSIPLPATALPRLSDMLNLTRSGVHGKLKDLAELYNINIVKEPLYFILIAQQMEALLETIEDKPQWDSTNIREIHEDLAFFEQFMANWYKLTGRDIMADALRVRRRT